MQHRAWHVRNAARGVSSRVFTGTASLALLRRVCCIRWTRTVSYLVPVSWKWCLLTCVLLVCCCARGGIRAVIQEPPRSGESEPFSCSGAPCLGKSESESIGGSREELAVLLQLRGHQLAFLKLFPPPENGDAGDSDAVRARRGGVRGRPPRGTGTAEPRQRC